MKWWRNAIAKNMRFPTNSYPGYFAERHMIKKNAFLEKNAVELCDIQSSHHILEVGFGPGVGLQAALKKVKDGSGKIYGIDQSPSVVEKAWKRHEPDLVTGKLDLMQGNVMLLPYATSQFDRVFHCNCHFYWRNHLKAAKELIRVLKPNTFMVTAMNLGSIKKLKEKGMLLGNMDLVAYMAALETAGFVNIGIDYLQDQENGKEFQAIFAHVGEKKIPRNL